MQFGLKLLISGVAAILLCAFLFLVDRGDNGPADAFLWRGGGKDPFRRLIMHPDGRLKGHVKPLAALLFALFMAVFWAAA
jgi:hypothetical protein